MNRGQTPISRGIAVCPLLPLAWSRARSITAIYLGTTAAFVAAHRFYEKNGPCEIDRSALPEVFPIMAVDTKFCTREP